MRHYRNTDGAIRSDNSPLLEQVFSILDSRIQFIDYQVQRYFTSCTSTLPSFSDDKLDYSGPSCSGMLVSNLEQLLCFTEKLQQDLKLLQILRAWLKEETVQEILELMTNNKYLSYSEDKLEYLLKEKAQFFYAA